MNYNIVDIVVLIFILLYVVNGFKRGFIMSLFDLVGTIASFFLAWSFNHIIRGILLEKTEVFEFIYSNISKRVSAILELLPGNDIDLKMIFKGYERLPIDIQKLLDEYIVKNSSLVPTLEYGDILAEKITIILIHAVSFIITFLVIYFLLMVVAGIMNTIFKAPILNLANRFLGGALGTLKAIVMLYIIFAIASPFVALSENDNKITTAILDSKSSEYFYENNIVLNYLTYKGIINNNEVYYEKN